MGGENKNDAFRKLLLLTIIIVVYIGVYAAPVMEISRNRVLNNLPFYLRTDTDTIPLSMLDSLCTDTSCVKSISVNVHYMLKSDGSGNFTETDDGYGNDSGYHHEGVTGYSRAGLMVEGANAAYSTVVRNWRSPEGTFAVPKRLRYILHGVYFHRNDTTFNSTTLLYPDFDGVTKKYGMNIGHEVNVFMTDETQNTGISGVVCCELTEAQYKQMGYLTIFLRDWEVWYKKGWDPGVWFTLNHEFGHLMGLQHDWEAQFPDMVAYPTDPLKGGQGCAMWDSIAGTWCNDWGHISNNSMGASSFDRTLTPDQIAFIHGHLETYLRGYVERCDCTPLPPPVSLWQKFIRLFSSRRTRKLDKPPR